MARAPRRRPGFGHRLGRHFGQGSQEQGPFKGPRWQCSGEEDRRRKRRPRQFGRLARLRQSPRRRGARFAPTGLPAGERRVAAELHKVIQRRPVQVRHGRRPRGRPALRALAREARSSLVDPAVVRIPPPAAAAGDVPAVVEGALAPASRSIRPRRALRLEERAPRPAHKQVRGVQRRRRVLRQGGGGSFRRDAAACGFGCGRPVRQARLSLYSWRAREL
mmetsp:Transcript_4682/g.14848  ORF Transcript_4682/g.14848 Transcript_4682/m.14848 type:complete len:220 (+) Transcript_4682:863-1522(+)